MRILQQTLLQIFCKISLNFYPMNTNMTGLRFFFKNLCGLVFWTKATSALFGFLRMKGSKRGCHLLALINICMTSSYRHGNPLTGNQSVPFFLRVRLKNLLRIGWK